MDLFGKNTPVVEYRGRTPDGAIRGTVQLGEQELPVLVHSRGHAVFKAPDGFLEFFEGNLSGSETTGSFRELKFDGQDFYGLRFQRSGESTAAVRLFAEVTDATRRISNVVGELFVKAAGHL